MATKISNQGMALLPYSERVKLVRERLNGLRRPKVESLSKPAKVLAAEKLVSEWEEKNDAHEEAQRTAWRAKLHEVQDQLIVGDMARAVLLLQKLGA
jgi:hypothetical protein